MKKISFLVIFFVIISCGKKKEESYIINNHEYIIKTDSVQELLIYKDTLKFYYLKGKLRSVTINDFIEPEPYDTDDKPFFVKTIYCINENNEFDAVTDYLLTNRLASFEDNHQYSFKNDIWQNDGKISDFFYDYEAMNLDIALTRNNNYNFPKFIRKISKDSLTLLSIDQDKEIDFYDVKTLKKIKNQSQKSFVFKYLKEIKIINNGKEKLILAKIIEGDYYSDNEVYINLKDIISDIRMAT